MEPIDTVYRGDYFRSRTEARWAVFFSTMDIEYEYEPQGYDLDGLHYLPDFWLPGWEMWVEIKGAEDYSYEELKKAHRLSAKSTSPVVMILGQPGIERDESRDPWEPVSHGYTIHLYLGPVGDRISHPRVEVGPVRALDDHILRDMAKEIRGLFKKPVYYDQPEDVGRIKGWYKDLLEYSPLFGQQTPRYSTAQENWDRYRIVMSKCAFSWSDSDDTLKIVKSAYARFSPGIERRTRMTDSEREAIQRNGENPDLVVRDEWEGEDRLYRALRRARYVRFEHGESPD